VFVGVIVCSFLCFIVKFQVFIVFYRFVLANIFFVNGCIVLVKCVLPVYCMQVCALLCSSVYCKQVMGALCF